MKLLIWLRYESPATSSTAATKSWSLTVKKPLATNQPRLLISYTHIPLCALRIDLFSFYVLSSQFRSCDNTLGNCFVFQIWSYSPAHIRKICEKKMKQIPLSPVSNIVLLPYRTQPASVSFRVRLLCKFSRFHQARRLFRTQWIDFSTKQYDVFNQVVRLPCITVQHLHQSIEGTFEFSLPIAVYL